MPDAPPSPNPPADAVFLSYASQDAAAVGQIAAALRASGVEVWFDKDELVGGDAWDAKIRGQIASCALFVPVISAATQARLEGYFRIEWKLAAQRTHAMAEEKAFLLPVVIDGTRDGEAKVPGEFRTVQWTRLPGGEGVEKFCARVGRLLGGDAVGSTTDRAAGSEVGAPLAGARGRGRATSLRKPARAWLVPAVVGLLIVGALAGWRPWRGAETKSSASVPISEASRLVAQAWAQMDKTEMARSELLLAEGFCRQAAALDESNPAVWAAWSAMNTWYYFHQFERVPARKEAARDYAQKALALDPKSYEARYAWAHFIVRMTAEGKIGDERPALPVLRELLRERPDEPRALYALGFGLICDPANADEGFSTLERLAEKHPAFAGRALNEVGWMALFYGRLGLAESAAERALKAQPYWNNLGLKATLALRLYGDLDLAQATIDRLPPTALQENWGISLAVMVADWRGDHSRAVAILQGVPRDWLENFFYFGPTSFLSGQMRLKAKQVTAAEKDFRRALEVIAPRLEKAPNDPTLLYYRAEAQRLLGMREEADRSYRQLREVWPDTFAALTFEQPEAALAYVRRMVVRGHGIEYVFPSGWNFTVASLRLDPMFENVRPAPGFSALIDETEQREKQMRSRTTVAAGSKTVVASSDKAVAPEKSVAVLAFANLSDDKANEYFSDGISEELLNVLAKVPGLKVTARTSAFHFKGKDTPIPEIAKQLGVAYVIEGSVRKSGDKVRIAAQLIKAADGFQVWSENFNRDLKDIFAVQDEIAGLIAKQLSLTLGVGSAASTAAVNPEAFDLYLQGRQALNSRRPELYDRAEQQLNRAIELAPDFARAHATLGDLWIQLAQNAGKVGAFGDRNSPELARIAARARQALALDPKSAEAHALMGGVHNLGWRADEAARELRQAIALNPTYVSAHQRLGRTLVRDGRMDEGLAELKRAAELDPLWSRGLDNYASVLRMAGRHTESLAVAERAVAVQPDNVQAWTVKSRTLLALGRADEAVALVLGLPADSDVAAVAAIEVLAVAGRKPEAEAHHARANEFGSNFFVLAALGRRAESIAAFDPQRLPVDQVHRFLFDPICDLIRDDPRVVQALATLGLTEAHARAQAWRKAHAPEKPEARK